MVIKKASVVLLASLLASSTALAGDPLPVVSDLNIKLGAYAAFESGFSNQGKLKGSEKNISANKRGFAFITIRLYLLPYQILLMTLLMVPRSY